MNTRSQPHHFNGCRFDPRDGSLSTADGGRVVTLRPQAARLLDYLLDQPGEIISRDRLIAAIWEDGRIVDFEAGLAALLREVRSALDDVGAGSDLVETIPRRGYRFRGQIEEAQRRQAPRGEKRAWLLAGLAVLALIVIVLIWLLPAPAPDERVRTGTLAIIPFELYGRPAEDDRRVELLLADTLLGQLWQADLDAMVLIGRATLRPYQEREDVAAAVAEDLGVQLLIEGTVVADEVDQWQVTARMLEMPAGRVLWSSSLSWEAQPKLPVSDTVDYLIADLVARWPEIQAELD
ncbi:winged helix-turn-helix domain-containing protein [Wenzhouxiangella sp. AB-CW3]|uniref:winged helix-turn-helix domain-containing protein n=1 Tax=Wenzhouxiangella sp. AB-CW3 TaxID=2771012 RepID=UPI00168AD44A|nr:winged helix-turn-helix domain-containing protein [Wenzhouxiangella sp. AB-CW3]QOC21676.1 winged helix-turn-helix domain-containing protein [Wenzhouxiangella sp. AB-CW3]